MNEAVTDVIVMRAREPQGLTATVMWSVGLHVAVLAVGMVLPDREPPPPRTVMTISLGGVPGPKSEGMTQAGGRAVQAPQPVQPVRPRVETPPETSASFTYEKGALPREGNASSDLSKISFN